MPGQGGRRDHLRGRGPGLKMLGVDREGLDPMDKRILNIF